MTPIEKLRKGLDERGVRHIDHDGRCQEWTVLYDPDTTHWSLYGSAFKYTSKQGRDGRLYVKTSGATDWVDMTPEQAIAATVGAGTCHIEERHGDWYCTNCGEMVGTCDPASELFIDGNAIELWRHCPNCGARIEKVKDNGMGQE